MTDQFDAAQISRGLTKAQRAAVYPGPGNPEYARGPLGSMRVLERGGLVKQVRVLSVLGKRGALLTPLGIRVRAALEAMEKPDAQP